MRTYRRLLLLGLILSPLVSGCAITMKMHANRFQTPEVEGRSGGGYVDIFGSSGSNELVMTDDTTQNPPRLGNPYFLRSAREYYLGGGIGIQDKFNIELRNPLSDTGILEAKYQILGEPRNQAKQGNFSLAGAAGIFYTEPSGHDQSYVFDVTTDSKRKILTLDASLIAGYRIWDALLVYGSTSFTHNSYDGTLNQTVSGTLHSYNFSGTASQVTFNVGLEWMFGRGLLKLEEAYAIANATQTNTTKTARGYLGLAAGFCW